MEANRLSSQTDTAFTEEDFYDILNQKKPPKDDRFKVRYRGPVRDGVYQDLQKWKTELEKESKNLNNILLTSQTAITTTDKVDKDLEKAEKMAAYINEIQEHIHALHEVANLPYFFRVSVSNQDYVFGMSQRPVAPKKIAYSPNTWDLEDTDAKFISWNMSYDYKMQISKDLDNPQYSHEVKMTVPRTTGISWRIDFLVSAIEEATGVTAMFITKFK